MTETPKATFASDEAFGRALVERTAFEKEAVWLPLLTVHHWNAGQMSVKGKTFTDCLIEGPAVIAVMGTTQFEDCAMGAATDTRTLLYRPLGDKLAGVVGIEDCKFVRCRFVQVGFTGSEALLEELQARVKQATAEGEGAAK
ncbi:hypothetical protein [Brevundimonas sp.]|jgi:hypothetical protein|uniref:hypothetical protein n=1 Tax=Brevundimonas sp. TaxID=1871086 RepID=UPI002E115ABE|nr:hypothetical protein [Brevundimonas sp.]